MSGISARPLLAVARLTCDRCGEHWESDAHSGPFAFMAQDGWCDAAWRAGWRVFVGKRFQRTYCPDCGPSVPMRQVYPSAVTS